MANPQKKFMNKYPVLGKFLGDYNYHARINEVSEDRAILVLLDLMKPEEIDQLKKELDGVLPALGNYDEKSFVNTMIKVSSRMFYSRDGIQTYLENLKRKIASA